MKNKLNHIKLGFVCVLVICILLATSQILQAEAQTSQWDYLIPDLLITNGKIITVDEASGGNPFCIVSQGTWP
ncbi:unnamed protein product [marine sediment metagenome]|uniref:Uncharacterized protein n=1 Tax=marine sediment metagenome TaxID=412755 RepID=X1E229_9ZZZZ